MVGTREAVAGGAAPHRNERIQLVGQSHVQAGSAWRLTLIISAPPYFLMLLVSHNGWS